MQRLARALLLVLVLCVGNAVTYAQGGLNDALLTEGAKNQVIQFNPNAALQSRIFAERFVPNSSEFSLAFEGIDYAAQRAESLSTGAVRVYFVRVGDWGNVRFTSGGDALDQALLTEAAAKQVIQFNPGASLQQRMFADGFVPNSSEFTTSVGGVSYAAQRAENLGNGQVRVYYVVVGDWANVRNTGQNQAAVVAPPPPALVAPPPPAPAPPPASGGRFPPSGANCPTNAPIKGNRSSSGEWIYHVQGQQAYNRTIPEDCFATEDAARAAGYRRALR